MSETVRERKVVISRKEVSIHDCSTLFVFSKLLLMQLKHGSLTMTVFVRAGQTILIVQKDNIEGDMACRAAFYSCFHFSGKTS